MTMKLVFIILLISFEQLLGQDSIGAFKNLSIKFIEQWPTLSELKKADNLTSKLSETFLGKKNYLLYKPFALITDSDCLWVLDQGSKSITFVENNKGIFPHFIEKEISEFPSLVGICKFNNNILTTDSYFNNIYVINNKNKKISLLNSNLKIDRPTGIAYCSQANKIWVVETNKHRVLILNNNGEIIKTIGKRGIGTAEFNYPTNICIDKNGKAYIVDAMNFRIQIFDSIGNFITMFGKNGDATGYFASPKGISVDSNGNIYVVDALLNNVQIFDISGNLLSYFGKKGNNDCEFWMPNGIFINSQDKIFVADSYNSRIQIFKLITN